MPKERVPSIQILSTNLFRILLTYKMDDLRNIFDVNNGTNLRTGHHGNILISYFSEQKQSKKGK